MKEQNSSKNRRTYLKRIGEQVWKRAIIFHEFGEIFHKQLCLNSPVPWCIDAFQLVTEMNDFCRHKINPLIQSFEMIKCNLHHNHCTKN